MKRINPHGFRVCGLVIISLLSLASVAALLAFAASAARRASSLTGPSLRTSVTKFDNTQNPNAPNAPVITATLSDNTAAATKVTPGSTITYTAVITNSAAPGAGNDATSMIFSNPLDANTTLVPNSVNASPIAVSDSYPVYGNVNISIPDGGTDLLANDIDPETGNSTGLTLTTTGLISSANCAACNNVNINANGSFTYDPPVGFTGTDTFTYTVRDNGADGVGGNGDDTTAQGTVTLNISGMIWFINNAAAACTTLANQCGKLSKPFSTLDSFRAVNLGGAGQPAAGHDIFIYQSATENTLTAALTLLANQRVIGQDSAPNATAINNAALFNITLPTGSATLPSTDTGGTTASITAFGLTTATGNTIRGLTVNNTGVNTKLAGTSFGTLTLGDINMTGTGKALNLVTGTLATHASAAVQFGTLSSTSSASQGVQLASVAGSLTATGGAITGSTSSAFQLGDGIGTANTGGTVVVTYPGTLTATGSSRCVDIQDRAAGAGNITFSGTLTHTTGAGTAILMDDNAAGSITFSGANSALNGFGSTAVNLTDNTGATINFTGGGLDIDSTTATAFNVTGGGTINVTGSTNSITSTTGIALNVANTTIGASNLIFRSISANGAASGIVLNTTGSTGGLVVTGGGNTSQGGDNSGGMIQNTTSHGVSLNNTSNVSFNNLRIDNTGDQGINGVLVNNFTFTYGTINNAGNGSDESAISFDDAAKNVSGTLTVTNSNLTLCDASGIDVEQSDGVFTDVIIQNNTITSEVGVTDPTPGSAVKLICNVTTTTACQLPKATLSGNTIGSATNSFNEAGFVIQGNSVDNAASNSVLLGTAGSPTNVINVTGNFMNGGGNGTDPDIGFQADRFITAAPNGKGQANFNFSNNGSSGNEIKNIDGVVIELSAFGQTTVTAVINNNWIIANNGVSSAGITSGCDADSFAATTDNATLTSTITNNHVSRTDGQGIFAIARNSTCTLNTAIKSNTVLAPKRDGVQYGIQVSSGSASGNTTVCADIASNDTHGNAINTGTGSLAPGIGLRKQGSVSGTNFFGIEGMAATTSPGIETYVGNAPGGKNPLSANGTFGNFGVALISGTNFGNCSSAPIPNLIAIQNKNAGSFSSTMSFLDSLNETPLEMLARVAPWFGHLGEVKTGREVLAQTEPRILESTETCEPFVEHHEKSYATRLSALFDAAANKIAAAVRELDSLITPTVYAQVPNAPQSGETITINGGGPGFTLPAGKSITVTFSATVNTTALTARQATTQGTVTANGGINVTTDDPDVGGTQATITLLDTTLTWTGATNTDWNTATNWNRPGPVVSSYAPGVSNPAVNDVFIPNVGAQPNISATDIGIYSLNISNGRTLTITNPRVLTIGGSPGGDLTLDGIISGGFLNLGSGTHVMNNAGGTGSLSSSNVATVLSGGTVTLNNDLQAGALGVNAGGSMNITNRTLSLNGTGGLVVPGGATFTTTGSTVIFNGTAAQQAAGIAYNNLTINNTAAGAPNALGATLAGNATVNGVLALTSNDLNTGGFTLTQPNTTASTGAGDVVGTVIRSGGPFGLISLTFGNPNNIITFTGAGTRPTTMTAVLAKAAPATFAAAVQRNYTLSQTGGSGFTATVRLHYLDSELNGNTPETALGLRRLRAADSHWVAAPPPPGVPTRDGAANWVEATGVLAADLATQWTFSTQVPTASGGTVTGRIVDQSGNPVEGAVVRLEGTQNRKFITDANGVYRFDNVETNGFYTVTPSRANYSFTPAVRSFSQLGETTEAAFGATLVSGGFVNPLDTPEYFVRQHYLDFLGREPDEAGFNFWSDQILECAGDVQCTERRRENVSAAYFLSIEFRKTGGLVDGLYRASYGVAPQYAAFMPDTRTVGLGVQVGKEGWEELLRANTEAFVNSFVNRPEFHQLYDGMDNSLFVDTLISHTGVTFTAAERDALVSGLGTGTMTRAEALLSIAEDGRFANAKFNETFVMMEYYGYLRRDYDAEGYAFWLNKLNEFNGNFEQAEMVKAFIVSGEYRDRFPR